MARQERPGPANLSRLRGDFRRRFQRRQLAAYRSRRRPQEQRQAGQQAEQRQTMRAVMKGLRRSEGPFCPEIAEFVCHKGGEIGPGKAWPDHAIVRNATAGSPAYWGEDVRDVSHTGINCTCGSSKRTYMAS